MEWAPTLSHDAREALAREIGEALDGVGATYQIQAMILREQLETARGVSKLYRYRLPGPSPSII